MNAPRVKAEAVAEASVEAAELAKAAAAAATASSPRLPAPRPRQRLTHAQRRERVLNDIARERVRMQEAADVLVRPLRRIDSWRGKASGASAWRQWLYPAAPVVALLAYRFRPRLGAISSLAARGWTIWRIYRRFR
jgi:hypothetical protein